MTGAAPVAAAAVLAGVCWPLAHSLALAPARTRPLAGRLAPWAPLPLLLVALLGGSGSSEYHWLLFGGRLGIDAVGAALLPAMTGLWLAAGLAASSVLADDPRRHTFFAFFLVTMAGNFLLLLALDAIAFYLGFTVMTFGAYGLIVHDGSDRARHAGRYYIALAVLGEVCVIVGLMLTAGLGDTGFATLRATLAAGEHGTAIGLLIAGFGVKAGLVGAHYWLPLAHPVAPTPASAVLSGAMIKAGLLAWIRLLPLGEAALPAWGSALAAAGLMTAAWGVFAGLPQREAKTVLAYSSMSQMGLMMVPVGLGLGTPDRWPLLGTALLVFMVHHCLAKGTLFLGIAVMKTARGRVAVLGRFVLTTAALSLSAAPLTAGLLAKTGIKAGAAGIIGPWHDHLPWLLALSSVLTALLMLRFLRLAWPAGAGGGPAAGLLTPWLLLFAAALSLPWMVGDADLRVAALARRAQWGAVQPLLVTALLAAAAHYLQRTGRLFALPALPPGDLGIALERLLLAAGDRARSASLRLGAAAASARDRAPRAGLRANARWESLAASAEDRLMAWSVTGTLVAVLGVTAAWLLM
ncbi:complex I subunit 5 family protein [Lentisalinibacter salinarum]|uniref:complex I subunit 5 family protein n=1 Tax=Lentisalinibacter salinarum TaxID=2992239 RepID=UPI00386A8D3E